MIIQTSMGHIALYQLPAEPTLRTALMTDLAHLTVGYGMAIEAAWSGVQRLDGEWFSLDLAERLILASVRGQALPPVASMSLGDVHALIEGIYTINGLDIMGKMLARALQQKLHQMQSDLQRFGLNMDSPTTPI